MPKHLTGGVLTGGMARRLQSLGDIDKGLLDLQGQPLVAHVAQTLQPYCQSPLLISANRHHDQYEQYGQIVADPVDLANYQGPLAGILAMLEVLSTEWLMVLPVDTPFVSGAVIQELCQAQLQLDSVQLFYVQHERTYPLCLLVHKEQRKSLRAYLESGQRRVQSWLQQQQAYGVDCRHYPSEDFFNINTPEEVKSAQLRAL